jgi:dihydroorotase-like cyclic amidohydrolase
VIAGRGVAALRAGRPKAGNTPFHGWKLRGKALATVVGGEVRYREAPAD